MYLDRVFCYNMGPLRKVNVSARFAEDRPVPIVIVGKNGSGKSILLSNIVDALHEFGSVAFNDITVPIGANGHRYYKLAMSSQISLGEKTLLGLITFKTKDAPLEYLYHRGIFDKSELKKVLSGFAIPVPKVFSSELKNTKKVTQNEDLIKGEFQSSVLCYFPAYRYAIPDWEGASYAHSRENPLKRTFSGELNRPIVIDNARVSTAQWLEDVVVDSRCDVFFKDGRTQTSSNLDEKRLLNHSKGNAERILSTILEQDIELKLGYRSEAESRLTICKKGTFDRVVPTFDAMSTGQSILADIFITIVRYADAIDINKSIRLEDIEGIVVIDEIDAHLHADLQYGKLPELMKLFPKVQFVITAHSPLFVLGMRDAYGDDGFDLIELPDGTHIEAESYKMFLAAYKMMADSRKAKEDRQQIIEAAVEQMKLQPTRAEKLLIVTEGPTDWMHMERAWKHLRGRYPELIDKIEFFHYYPKKDGAPEPQLDMGRDFPNLCKHYAKLGQHGNIVFVCDADVPTVSRDMMVPGSPYKSWGNNVYSFHLPDPGLRPGFSDVCIEHYYSDAELKTPKLLNGVNRRLFLANEFNAVNGLSRGHEYVYANRASLGKSDWKIIDGNGENRVFKTSDDEGKVNLTLSKYEFASAVYNEEEPFAQLGFEPFSKIFDVLKQIVMSL